MARRDTALVTGASAGIGREVALELAERDFDLILVARRQPELEHVAEQCRSHSGVDVTVLPTDLLEPDAAAKLVARVSERGLRVDLLVNDAGRLDMAPFLEIPVEHHEALLQLNVVCLVSLTRRLLPAMLARGHGRVLNVASTSAFQPIPSLALYAASKALVLSLSESLSEELRGTGVTVTALCPGFTRTPMLDSARHDSGIAREIPDFFISDVKTVAREGIEGCLAGRAVVVPGLTNRLGASLVQLQPRWLVRAIGGLVGRYQS
jgi:short-subunit dehydrogenase